MNISVVMKQALVGGYYGLLDTNLYPLPVCLWGEGDTFVISNPCTLYSSVLLGVTAAQATGGYKGSHCREWSQVWKKCSCLCTLYKIPTHTKISVSVTSNNLYLPVMCIG